jgi:hypothetical protein
MVGGLVAGVASLMCCWPAAIVAIILGVIGLVFGFQVSGKVATGDIRGAEDAARTAKTLCYISLGFGSVAIVLGLVFVILYGGLFFLGALANH